MMNKKLNEIAKNYSKDRLAVFLEGGYSLDIVGSASQNLLEELSGTKITSFGDTHTESGICTDYTKELVKVLKEQLKDIF